MCGSNPLNHNAISFQEVTPFGGELALVCGNRPVRNFLLTDPDTVDIVVTKMIDGGMYRLVIEATDPAFTLTLPANGYFTPGSGNTVDVTWTGTDRKTLVFTYVNETLVFWYEQASAGTPDEVLKASAALDTTLRQVSDYAGNLSQLYLATNKSAVAGRLSIGQSSAPNASADIKGEGATSGTSSLLIKNGSGTELLRVKDNGDTVFGGSSTLIDQNGFMRGAYWYDRANTGNYHAHVSDTLRIAFGNSIASAFRSAGAVIGDFNFADSAILTLNATTRGFLAPRMTTAQKNAIAAPANGLMVYDTDLGAFCFYRTADAAWKTISYT